MKSKKNEEASMHQIKMLPHYSGIRFICDYNTIVSIFKNDVSSIEYDKDVWRILVNSKNGKQHIILYNSKSALEKDIKYLDDYYFGEKEF